MADNRSAITNQNSASGISLLMREDEEFQEGEVWDVMNEKEKGEEDSIPKQRKSFPSASSSLSAAWFLQSSSPKMTIPMAKTCVNKGTKLAVNKSSAPLKIPDWSQIYMKKLNRGFWGIHGENEEMKTDHGYFVEFEDDDDDDNDEIIPPHEFIDRRLARTRIASYSMFEGIGRTLKGRDIWKLRNAVLIRTGFLEQ